MKISNKLRLFLSLISLLVCVCMSSMVVNADVIEAPVEETATTEADAMLYADGKLSLADAETMVQTYAQQAASMAALSAEELDYLDELYSSQTDFYGSFAQVAGEEGCGTYAEYSNVEVVETEEKDVVEIKAELKFSEKNVIMTLNVHCYDNLGPVIKSTAFSIADEAEESISDKLKGAAMNTIVGMGTVFIVLILISLIISCFNFIPKIQAMFTKKEETQAEVSKVEVPVAVDNEVKTDNLELIAVITAAIAASENTTTDSFVVRSIRKR